MTDRQTDRQTQNDNNLSAGLRLYTILKLLYIFLKYHYHLIIYAHKSNI